MNHTPAPWHIDRTRKSELHIWTNGIPIIATVPDRHVSINEQEANARLISSAPELLDACKYVVQWHREHDSGEGELYGLDFVTTCIAAIAKAEGM